MSEMCEHGDIAAACLDCLTGVPPERPNRPEPAIRATCMPFPARHAGQCNGCNLGVHEGQPIVRTTADDYRHAGCVS